MHFQKFKDCMHKYLELDAIVEDQNALKSIVIVSDKEMDVENLADVLDV